MEKIKSLDWFQKGIVLLMVFMTILFAAVYSKTIDRIGYSYKGEILVPSQENDCTVYSGRIQGEEARFTVSADKTVEFQYGAKSYGPYTVKEDPTAIPENREWRDELRDAMIGIEMYRGKEITFRGSIIDEGDSLWVYNEDGTFEHITSIDDNNDRTEPMEPSVSQIIALIRGPRLTHKGDWAAWVSGTFACLITVISILFADELFRLNLAFRIRNADFAEPSDWEITCRYIYWSIMFIIAMVIFIMGLQ